MLIYSRGAKFLFCFMVSLAIYFGIVGVYNKMNSIVIKQNEENRRDLAVNLIIDR